MLIFHGCGENKLKMSAENISQVAALLRPVSKEVFNGKGKLCLSTNYLHTLNSAFDANISEESNLSFHIVQTSNSKANYIRDLKFLLDLIQRTISLKIIPDVTEEYSNVDIARFKNIKVLEIHKVDIMAVIGLQKVRTQLEDLTCCHSIAHLTDILDKCGGDKSQRYSWCELKRANFSHNNIVELDDSVDCMMLLQSLDLSHNQITKIDFLNQLPNLKYLNISYNKLDKVPRFKGQICSRLQVLILNNNFIEDLSGVTTLSNVLQLDLSHNCIVEHKLLLSVSHLISLQWLNVQGNPISYHPQHRNQTCNYLNKNSSTLKFVLDNVPLSKSEKSLTGSLYPIFQTSHFSVSSASSDESTNDSLQERTRKIRNVVIEDEDEAAVKPEVLPVATPTASFQHLELKKQVEQLREEYGESWLYRHSGMLVQDALGFEKTSIISSTPNEFAFDLALSQNQRDVLPDSTTFETADSKLSTTTNEDFQTAEEDTMVFNKTEQVDEDISDVSDGEDICSGGEECIFLAVNVNDSDQVFVVVTETHISERDVTTSKEKARWHINTISSCNKVEDKENSVKIEFDTIRRDRKQRIYELEPDELESFYDAIQEKIVKVNNTQKKKKLYQCMKCSELFPEKNKNALLEGPSIACPKCKSNIVIESN